MKNIERKIENTPSSYIKGIFQESDIFLSQCQPKNLLKLLSNSSISRNPSLPKWILKCNDKRCKICKLYPIECSEIELANREIWKIKTNITCGSIETLYSPLNLEKRLTAKNAIVYENYDGKT